MSTLTINTSRLNSATQAAAKTLESTGELQAASYHATVDAYRHGLTFDELGMLLRRIVERAGEQPGRALEQVEWASLAREWTLEVSADIEEAEQAAAEAADEIKVAQLRAVLERTARGSVAGRSTSLLVCDWNETTRQLEQAKQESAGDKVEALAVVRGWILAELRVRRTLHLIGTCNDCASDLDEHGACPECGPKNVVEISVAGGVAYVASVPAGVRVIVTDHDAEGWTGDCADVHAVETVYGEDGVELECRYLDKHGNELEID